MASSVALRRAGVEARFNRVMRAAPFALLMTNRMVSMVASTGFDRRA